LDPRFGLPIAALGTDGLESRARAAASAIGNSSISNQ
jgi:hypothetical protein